MTTKITRDNAHEQEAHRFVAFASDLGFRPGDFPATIETTLGNGQPFARGRVSKDAGGDVAAVDYRQLLGCVSLCVLND